MIQSINPNSGNFSISSQQIKNISATPLKPSFMGSGQGLGGAEMVEALKGYNNFSTPNTKRVQVKVPDDIKLTDEYQWLVRNSAADIIERANRIDKKGQFLNWIVDLPMTQIEQIDKIYEVAEKARQDGKTDLAVIGIGGSRHTTEALTKLLGVDSKVHFYSAVDPESFKRFSSSLDLDKTQFLVVSKSGGTIETTTGYEKCQKLMQEHLEKTDVNDRFYAATDASAEKSALRRKVEAGELSDGGLVHDDVGGRFSIFDDATLFTLAYLGVPKDDVVRMLKSSLSAQAEFLNPNVEKNDALKLALSNVVARNEGCKKHFVEYFGDAFYGATLWEKQLKNESLKSRISTDTNVGPAYLHYNAESDLDKGNQDSFYTFVYTRPQDKISNAVIKGVTTAYKAQHPVSEIILDDLSPESIGRFIELKHFETLYTGNMLRREKGDSTPQDQALPEVLQPNVEIYKKEVKAALNE